MPATEQKQANSNTLYFQVREHKLIRSDKTQHDPSWERRVVFSPADKDKENPIVKYYKFYEDISGTPVNLYWYDSDDNPYKGYRLELQDEDTGEIYNIDISAAQKDVISKFCLVAENIDWDAELKISAFPSVKKDSDGKPKKNKYNGEDLVETAFIFYQRNVDGEWKPVPRKYNKDNPVPNPPTQNKKTKVWSFDAYYEYLYTQVDLIVDKYFPTKVEKSTETSTDEEESEIPF